MTHAIHALARIADVIRAGGLECVRPDAAGHTEIFQGRGGATLLTVQDAQNAAAALAGALPITQALAPLARIADAYDANELDDEARKYWGLNLEHTNTTDPAQIELVCNGSGARLLTLAHALQARTEIAG